MNAGPESSPPRLSSPRKARRYRIYIWAAVVAIVVLAVAEFLAIRWIRGANRSKGFVVAAFRADFQPGTPKAGWRYLWNERGPLGAPTNYAELQWSETLDSAYVSDARAPYPNPVPARYLRVTAEGGHPGHGPSQSKIDYEYYAILAFTVPERGTHRLANSLLTRHKGGKAGSVHLRVFVNDAEIGPEMVCRSTEEAPFDRDLGPLSAGDTVYVAVGPGDVDGEDGFGIDFAIVR